MLKLPSPFGGRVGDGGYKKSPEKFGAFLKNYLKKN